MEMEEGLKDKILIVCIVIGAIILVLAIASGINVQRNKVKFQKEMALRLDMEEQLGNSKFAILALEEEIRKLQNQVNTKEETYQQIAEELEQEQMVNKALKEELIKITKRKEALENELKEALASKPSEKK